MSDPKPQDEAGGASFALATLAIHGGQAPDPSTGAVMPPIYATSTYAQASPGVHQGFEFFEQFVHFHGRPFQSRCDREIPLY